MSCSLYLLVASLLRQNGALFAISLLLFSSIFLPGLRRVAAGLSMSIMAALVVTKVLLFPAIGIRPTPTHATLATVSHDIASLAAAEPAAFAAPDRTLLESVAPFHTWQVRYANFGCSTASWTFDPSFRWDRLDQHGAEFLRLWAELFLDHPGRILGHRLCASSVAWRPDPVGVLYTVSAGIDPNDQRLETVPISDELYRFARSAVLLSDNPSLQWLLWRAPLWIYGAYGAVAFIAWRRKQAVLLLLVVPLASQQSSVLLVNPSQDARYMMFSFVYASCWLRCSPPSRSGRPSGRATTALKQLALNTIRRARPSGPPTRLAAAHQASSFPAHSRQISSGERLRRRTSSHRTASAAGR